MRSQTAAWRFRGRESRESVGPNPEPRHPTPQPSFSTGCSVGMAPSPRRLGAADSLRRPSRRHVDGDFSYRPNIS